MEYNVFYRLVEDICGSEESEELIADTIMSVYLSWISDAISNYNSDFFYQSRQYIHEGWKAGEVI